MCYTATMLMEKRMRISKDAAIGCSKSKLKEYIVVLSTQICYYRCFAPTLELKVNSDC